MEETTIDLKDILKTLKKRSKLILSVFAGAVVIALAVSFLIPPTYQAETTLRIKQPKGLANSLLADLPAGNNNTKQLMSTYAEILKSRTVVEEVIDKTQADKPKRPTYEGMLKRITTQPLKDTEILKVNVTAKSPEEAQLVANTLVNTFNGRMTFLTRSEQSEVRKFIGERLQESKQELEKAESNLQQYKTEEKLVAPTEETKALVDRMSAIYKLTAENQATTAAAQAKLSVAQKELSQEKPGFVADSPLIQQYKGKLADLEVQLVTLTQNYTDKHPQVMATRAAIAETRANLDAEAARIVNAEAASMNPVHQNLLQERIKSEAEMNAASAQQNVLSGILGQDDAELSQLPVKEQGLAKVMRDATVAQEIYVMLAKRHEEARIGEVMQPTDVQVIDIAALPENPISPKKGLNVVIAAILGLFAGTAMAFALEYMNKMIKTADDVRNYLDLPVLGSIPDFDSSVRSRETGFWNKLKRLMDTKVKRGV